MTPTTIASLDAAIADIDAKIDAHQVSIGIMAKAKAAFKAERERLTEMDAGQDRSQTATESVRSRIERLNRERGDMA